jgi:hypothetical protein
MRYIAGMGYFGQHGLKNLLLLAFTLASAKASADCDRFGASALTDLQSRQERAGYSAARRTQWFAPGAPPSSVVLVLHGLNLKPDKMNSYVQMLNDAGHKVLRVTLAGHGENFREFYAVSATSWQNDFEEVFCIATAEANKDHVPLNVLAYSTGAPVTAAAISDPTKNYRNIHSLVYVSPAFGLGGGAKLIRLLLPFGWFSLKSMNLPQYRAHSSTPIRGYRALVDTMDGLNLQGEYKEPLDLPSLIILDPKDEMVDVSLIRNAATKYSKWKLIWTDTSKSKIRSAAPHHSVIDADLVGSAEWTSITSAIVDFLK